MPRASTSGLFYYKKMDNWFIKIHRKILDWEWYDDINTCRLFCHLLLKCNYEDNKWHWKTIKRGQRITSLNSLSKETGLTIQQTRTSIIKLKSTGEITDQTTNSFRLITVINYELYQANQQANQQASNKRVTTNKEREEYKEVKNITISDFDKNSIPYFILEWFLKLWFYYNWKKNEFENWCKELCKINWIRFPNDIKKIMSEFVFYWQNRWVKITNHKICLQNSPLLPNNVNKYAKKKTVNS